MNWKILLAGLAVVGLLVAVLASGFGKNPRVLTNSLEGRPAADFTLTSLDGAPVTLSSFRGRPVVMNFWATWCSPCIAENALLMELAKKYQPRGVVFLGVLYGDEPDRARTWVKRQGGNMYPTLMDPGQGILVDYAVGGVPETFFIAPDGTIARKVVGVVQAEVVVNTLEGLL